MRSTVKNRFEQEAFKQAAMGMWQEILSMAYTGDCGEKWLLDCEVCKVATGAIVNDV